MGQSRQAHIPRERSSMQRSSIFGVLCLCLHSLTQIHQIRHGNTYWEGRVFKRSVTPLYLHKASRGLSATAELLVVYEGLPARSHTHDVLSDITRTEPLLTVQKTLTCNYPKVHSIYLSLNLPNERERKRQTESLCTNYKELLTMRKL